MLSLILAAALASAAPADPGESGVRAVENEWSRAFVSGDAGYLEQLLDPAYVSVGTAGAARTKAEIVGLAVKYAAAHPHQEAKPMAATSTIQVKGPTAVVRHDNDQDTSVDVFYYADGRWRAWYSQHTAKAPKS